MEIVKKYIILFFQAIFKALGLHDGTKKLLLVFLVLTVIQMPFSVPGLWRIGWGIYLSWKNNTTLFLATAPNQPKPPAVAAVAENEGGLPIAGPPAPASAHRHR